VVAVSCALFGVTYRYAVRGQEANLQLKGGVVAAFGLVRQIAQMRPVCLCFSKAQVPDAGSDGADVTV